VGEELVIETAMRDIGTKSAIMRHVVKMKGTTSVIADADVTFVIVGGDAGGGMALHGDLRGMFQNMPRRACEVCSMVEAFAVAPRQLRFCASESSGCPNLP